MAKAPVVAEAGRTSLWLSGPLGAIYGALEAMGIPWMRCPKLGIPTVSITHADDILVYLEAIQGRPILFSKVDR